MSRSRFVLLKRCLKLDNYDDKLLQTDPSLPIRIFVNSINSRRYNVLNISKCDGESSDDNENNMEEEVMNEVIIMFIIHTIH